jgi:hypothetical protein
MHSAALRPLGWRSLWGTIAVIACLTLMTARSGSAGLLDGVLSPCADPESHPFQPWSDNAGYALAPNGGFESDSSGWTLAGGAAVTAGNEPFHVTAASDAMSLSLPSGASAVSSQACVGILSPTLRLFARNTGSASSTLRVDVLYTDALGLRWSIPVGTASATGTWAPTPAYLVLANITALPLLTNGSARVSLRFTAQGTGGSWQIDDVYIDPYKGT